LPRILSNTEGNEMDDPDECLDIFIAGLLPVAREKPPCGCGSRIDSIFEETESGSQERDSDL
jgi:hypothetical protein